MRPILEAIAARAMDEPCCSYIGPDGAGHYVKMVHNGIEYADMQLIAESYLLLKYVGGFTNQELAHIFKSWNDGELHSYLIGITAGIFREADDRKVGQHRSPEARRGYLHDYLCLHGPHHVQPSG